MKNHKRDLALFNLAIDSKLRGCDLVSLRVDDIAASGSREGPGDGHPTQTGGRFSSS
jgi:integrase